MSAVHPKLITLSGYLNLPILARDKQYPRNITGKEDSDSNHLYLLPIILTIPAAVMWTKLINDNIVELGWLSYDPDLAF